MDNFRWIIFRRKKQSAAKQIRRGMSTLFTALQAFNTSPQNLAAKLHRKIRRETKTICRKTLPQNPPRNPPQKSAAKNPPPQNPPPQKSAAQATATHRVLFSGRPAGSKCDKLFVSLSYFTRHAGKSRCERRRWLPTFHPASLSTCWLMPKPKWQRQSLV